MSAIEGVTSTLALAGRIIAEFLTAV